MTDRMYADLLGAARTAPDDDDARLVLADYLESRGDAERATLVRLQVAHAKLPSWSADALRNRIAQRALLQAHGAALYAELPALDGVVWGGLDRGLVGGVAFDSAANCAAHLTACANATALRRVVLRWPRLEDRVDLPAVPGLREVRVVGTAMKVEDVTWLANSPLLSTVKVLDLVGNQFQAPLLDALLASPYLAQLEALRLPLHNFANPGMERLLQASMPNLRELDISVSSQEDLGSGGRYQETMDAQSAQLLAAWPGLAKLHTLDLTGNQVGMEGLAAVLSSKNAAGLKVLRLRGTADRDWMEGDGEQPDVLLAFGQATAGMKLEVLDVSECGLTDASRPILQGADALSDLKVLVYNYTQDNPFPHLMAAPWADSLEVLSATDCSLVGMRAILGRTAPKLHTVSLASTHYWSRVKDVGAVIAGMPPQPALLSLDLSESGMNDAGLSTLGEATSLPALLSLRVGDPDFGPEAAAAFATSPLGARLASIDFGMDGVDRAPEPEQVDVRVGQYSGALRYL